MPVVNYLTKTDLHLASNIPNLDPTVQQAVLDQLINDGLYSSGPEDGRKIWVESDIYNGVLHAPFFTGPNVSPIIQGLEVEGTNVTIQTDASLKAIVDDGTAPGTHYLTLTGGAHDVFVGLGNQGTVVTLQDHGDDTVISGNGSDTLIANGAADSLFAGGGDDSLVGGSGHDTLIGGSGHDTLVAGSGHNSLLQAGTGDTVITDLKSGGHDTLVSGSGVDTITGQQGDFFNPSMPASGGDIYNIYDGHGNSTINLFGNDTVNFFTTAGNDTINNGSTVAHPGTDTIDFTNASNHSFLDVKSMTEGTGAQTGDWTIKFNNGQSMHLNGHGVSSGDNAFVLQFNDTSVNLKGGS